MAHGLWQMKTTEIIIQLLKPEYEAAAKPVTVVSPCFGFFFFF